MAHVYHLSDVHLLRPSVVTIGVFDGVHVGHQHLIRRLVQEAHQSDRLAVVLTFFPHPDVVLRGLTGRYYLTSAEERAALMLDLGVDLVVTHPFNIGIRQMRAASFVDQLLLHLKMGELWVGEDFAMGFQREGNVAFLREEGARKGFAVNAIPLVQTENSAITSTRIRDALMLGNVGEAQALLGRPYRITGEVIHGDARGRMIGFPTANIDVWESQVLPSHGVYAGYAAIDNQRFMAVTNIGVRPTFEGQTVRIEAHILDFAQEVYGENIAFEFVEKLRGEKKFNGLEELIAQIREDVALTRTILKR